MCFHVLATKLSVIFCDLCNVHVIQSKPPRLHSVLDALVRSLYISYFLCFCFFKRTRTLPVYSKCIIPSKFPCHTVHWLGNTLVVYFKILYQNTVSSNGPPLAILQYLAPVHRFNNVQYEIVRCERDEDDDNLVVHYGLIAWQRGT